MSDTMVTSGRTRELASKLGPHETIFLFVLILREINPSKIRPIHCVLPQTSREESGVAISTGGRDNSEECIAKDEIQSR